MTLSLADKSVLVTGGAGFIGSHLVDRLIGEKPRRLAVVDNLVLGREANLQQARSKFPALAFHHADAADLCAMEQIVRTEQSEVIFNLAVLPLPASLERPNWVVNTNVAIAATACELVRRGLCQTLIHFSSSEAYGSAQYVPMDEKHPVNPSTPYAASKLAGDWTVLSYRETFGIDSAILRPFNNFGPRQNSGAYAGIIPVVVKRALSGESVTIFGDGKQTRDFIFVRDTADAAVRAYETPSTRGKIVNLASGRETTVESLVHSLLDAVGVSVPIVYAHERAGDVRRHCGDVGLARRLIDFEPRTDLRDGLVETVSWYRSELSKRECVA